MTKARKKVSNNKGIVWRLLLLVIFAFIGLQLWFAGHVFAFRYTHPDQTSFMKARLQEKLNKKPDAEIWHEWVDYDSISIHVKRAVVAAEDSKFVEHYGFDVDGIKYAMEKNLDKGKLVAGGSTITQQLAKNLFLSGERSLLRKAQEAVITLMLESMMNKRRILELYLNYAEWGDGVFGIQAAAWHYFDRPAAALSPWQAARLASMLPRPVYYDRNGATGGLKAKTNIIQKRMQLVWIPS